ncbi:tryptophan synthase subunit alpha [Streptomyces sp. VN1]|uniref:tryptophan synthase subunit alpha n=1 Tax=Streptomyces sp. VN1 TaxID=1821625 RepID=UPI001413E694|nr:tryptophan synthase subunit alpha [Streptomyces sp. VN1]QIP74729.1 tryptophan synthase subunit alpha [Streptomyces sp. VN1]
MRTSTPPSWPAYRLDQVLTQSRLQQRAALGLYLPVGYPSRSASRDALHAMAEHSDVLELGVPTEDAHLDGATIQHAAAQALEKGFRMADLFTITADLASSPAALVAMTYWAPVEAYGPRLFAEQFAAAGGAGVLIPDLPGRAAARWQHATEAAGLHAIPLIPAHASSARLHAIGRSSSGMAYAPATPGLTGAAGPLSPYLPRLVRRLREATRLPVAVGIGISTPALAAQASAYADAVVVGSAVIRRMQADAGSPAAAAAAAARDFAAGVRGAHRPAA